MEIEDKLVWYERRVKALEELLSCYRIHTFARERLHRELEATGQHVGHDGKWKETEMTERR